MKSREKRVGERQILERNEVKPESFIPESCFDPLSKISKSRQEKTKHWRAKSLMR